MSLSLLQALADLDDVDAGTVICQALEQRPSLCAGVASFAFQLLSTSITNQRLTGTVKAFHQQKSYGFIDCTEAHIVFGKDVFMHENELKPGCVPGTVVSFEVKTNQKNDPQAHDVQPSQAAGFRVGQAEGLLSLADVMKAARQTAEGAAPQLDQDWPSWGGGGGKGERDYKGKGMLKGGGMKGDFVSGNVHQGKPDVKQELGQYDGRIKSFSEKNGFGFIECDELKLQGLNDAFLHHQQIRNFKVGDWVSFTAFLNNKGQAQARDLQTSTFGDGSVTKRQKQS